MIFGRKLVCARCGFTMRQRDYDAYLHAVLAGRSQERCSHWFFDSRDSAGLRLGRLYEARQRTEA